MEESKWERHLLGWFSLGTNTDWMFQKVLFENQRWTRSHSILLFPLEDGAMAFVIVANTMLLSVAWVTGVDLVSTGSCHIRFDRCLWYSLPPLLTRKSFLVRL